MRALFALLTMTAAAHAGDRPMPVPTQSPFCPAGYHRTFGGCSPNVNTRERAIPRAEGAPCPAGWHASAGATCVENGPH
jgi:hypothetical protein